MMFESNQVSKSWQSTEAIIKEVETRSDRRDNVADKDYLNQSFEHELYIRYVYSVGNQDYTSTWKKAASIKSTDDIIEWSEFEQGQPFQIGNQVMIHYNPDNPNESELSSNSFSGNGIWGLLIGLFTIVGGILIFRSEN